MIGRTIRPRPLSYTERIPVIFLHRPKGPDDDNPPIDPALEQFLRNCEDEREQNGLLSGLETSRRRRKNRHHRAAQQQQKPYHLTQAKGVADAAAPAAGPSRPAITSDRHQPQAQQPAGPGIGGGTAAAPAIAVPTWREISDYTSNEEAMARADARKTAEAGPSVPLLAGILPDVSPCLTAQSGLGLDAAAYIIYQDLVRDRQAEPALLQYDMDDVDEKALVAMNAPRVPVPKPGDAGASRTPPATRGAAAAAAAAAAAILNEDGFEALMGGLERAHFEVLQQRKELWQAEVKAGKVPKLPATEKILSWEAAVAALKQHQPPLPPLPRVLYNHWLKRRKQEGGPLLEYLWYEQPWKVICFQDREHEGEQGDMPFMATETKNSARGGWNRIRINKREAYERLMEVRNEFELLRTTADQVRKRERLKKQLLKLYRAEMAAKLGLNLHSKHATAPAAAAAMAGAQCAGSVQEPAAYNGAVARAGSGNAAVGADGTVAAHGPRSTAAKAPATAAVPAWDRAGEQPPNKRRRVAADVPAKAAAPSAAAAAAAPERKVSQKGAPQLQPLRPPTGTEAAGTLLVPSATAAKVKVREPARSRSAAAPPPLPAVAAPVRGPRAGRETGDGGKKAGRLPPPLPSPSSRSTSAAASGSSSSDTESDRGSTSDSDDSEEFMDATATGRGRKPPAAAGARGRTRSKAAERPRSAEERKAAPVARAGNDGGPRSGDSSSSGDTSSSSTADEEEGEDGGGSDDHGMASSPSPQQESSSSSSFFSEEGSEVEDEDSGSADASSVSSSSSDGESDAESHGGSKEAESPSTSSDGTDEEEDVEQGGDRGRQVGGRSRRHGRSRPWNTRGGKAVRRSTGGDADGGASSSSDDDDDDDKEVKEEDDGVGRSGNGGRQRARQGEGVRANGGVKSVCSARVGRSQQRGRKRSRSAAQPIWKTEAEVAAASSPRSVSLSPAPSSPKTRSSSPTRSTRDRRGNPSTSSSSLEPSRSTSRSPPPRQGRRVFLPPAGTIGGCGAKRRGAPAQESRRRRLAAGIIDISRQAVQQKGRIAVKLANGGLAGGDATAASVIPKAPRPNRELVALLQMQRGGNSLVIAAIGGRAHPGAAVEKSNRKDAPGFRAAPSKTSTAAPAVTAMGQHTESGARKALNNGSVGGPVPSPRSPLAGAKRPMELPNGTTAGMANASAKGSAPSPNHKKTKVGWRKELAALLGKPLAATSRFLLQRKQAQQPRAAAVAAVDSVKARDSVSGGGGDVARGSARRISMLRERNGTAIL